MPPIAASPTIWGLTPSQIHDRFWASRGVQVVRRGERSEIVHKAELFLLLEQGELALFRLRDLVDRLSWIQPQLLIVRLRVDQTRSYRETIVSDDQGLFVRFERDYGGTTSHYVRVGLTPNPDLARQWQSTTSLRTAWRNLRAAIGRSGLAVSTLAGRRFRAAHEAEALDCLLRIQQTWTRPDGTVRRTRRQAPNVWADRDSRLDTSARFVGLIWIGAGRLLDADDCVAGPAILWDDPGSRPVPEDVQWMELEPTKLPGRNDAGGNRTPQRPPARRLTWQAGKRIFDLAFAVIAIAITLPLYPFIALAILIEDGWPIFFTHRRETLGDREFSCIKFRSMRRDAEHIKKALASHNQADGPQFFIVDDPRLTLVGRLLRKSQLDEIPQFWNVLFGHMSVVGPRPSPRAENQCCPTWREARLSVRPGLTGLWQVQRRRRRGEDFQEWIRYDLEYVERAGPLLDLRILCLTPLTVLRGIFNR